MKEFADIGCEAWQAQYTSEILDGTQWSLRYKLDGRNEQCFSGSNAFPVNWNCFMEWIEKTISSLPQAKDDPVEEILERIWQNVRVLRGTTSL